MAEEQQGQEKTEEPTQQKLDKAKEEGQVARSRELSTMVLVMLGAVSLYLFVPWSAARLGALTERLFTVVHPSNSQLGVELAHSVLEMTLVLMPFLLATTLAGVASSLAVGGLLFSTKAFAFKANRMSPIQGFKRIFSQRSLVEFLKSVAKVVLVTGVAVAVLLYVLDDLLSISLLPYQVAVAKGLKIVGVALLLIGLSLVLIAAIDIPFQIQQHKKQLKMTKQEVKDELKDREGKPEVKARIRQLQRDVSQRRMLQDVEQADVIITNPEHFSVAVRYQPDQMDAPALVAKGVDFMALKIREVGAHHNVPSLRAPALARAIYFSVEVGEAVPEELYLAVAQVLAYIYQLEAYRRGERQDVPQLGSISVPPAFRFDPAGELGG